MDHYLELNGVPAESIEAHVSKQQRAGAFGDDQRTVLFSKLRNAFFSRQYKSRASLETSLYSPVVCRRGSP